MGVSKNSGIPKWMVKIMENPIKMDDLGGNPSKGGTFNFSAQLLTFSKFWRSHSTVVTWKQHQRTN